MTKTPPEIDKYDTQKKSALLKWYALQTNAQKVTLFAKDWAEWFLKGNLNLMYDSDSW